MRCEREQAAPKEDTTLRGLRALRRRAGLTAAQLAARMGYTRTTIYYWETGQSWPSSEELPKLARILGCSIDDLFREQENTPKKEETP